MSSLTEVQFYWWKEENKICVQNMVAGYQGQYHEHTIADFEKWKGKINPKFLHEMKGKIDGK